MAEAEEDLVAYLRDEHETAVAPYVLAAAAIRCHHAHPACLHAVRLPVHVYTHTALSVRVGIAEHGCHLRLGQRHAHLRTRQRLYRGGDCLEAVPVVASLAHLMCHLDDDEVAQTLLRYVSYTFQERAVEAYDGTYTQGWYLTLSRDIMRLSRLITLITIYMNG